MQYNKIQSIDSQQQIKAIPDNSINLTLTSPPKDLADFKGFAKELFRITKEGGMLVWVTSDNSKAGTISGDSLRQAVYFMDECGFKIYDTIILETFLKTVNSLRYSKAYEFMFVFSKGAPNTIHIIKDKKKSKPSKKPPVGYDRDSSDRRYISAVAEFKRDDSAPAMSNIWTAPKDILTNRRDGEPVSLNDIPEVIADLHIRSWTEKGDIVFDPFCGIGNVTRAAANNYRRYLGFDIDKEKSETAKKRTEEVRTARVNFIDKEYGKEDED